MKSSRIRRWIAIAAVIIVATGAGYAGYTWYQAHHVSSSAAAAVTYMEMPVTKGRITQSVSGSGSIGLAETETVLVSDAATIAEVLVQEGDSVKAGDVLATFEGEDVSLAIQKAELSLKQQRMSLESAETSWKTLRASGAEDKEMEAAAVSIQNAQLAIEQTELEIVEYQKEADPPDPLIAPIDGTVTAVNVKADENTSARQEAFAIVNYDKLNMTISADELDITKLNIEQTARITLDALEGRTLGGRVVEIAKEGSASNGVATFPVTVALDEADQVLPGMSGQVEIIITEKEDALMVPVDAVEMMGDRYYVRVADGSSTGADDAGEAATLEPSEPGSRAGQSGPDSLRGADDGTEEARSERFNGPAGAPSGGFGAATSEGGLREITVGITTDSYVEVLSGLSEGDRVLIAISTTENSNTEQIQGGFPGGGMDFGGGMPSGGMGGGTGAGGMRGGGMGGGRS
ncbi:efflux RND transporter periplasmic adaptor subunit [Paenibacillus sp. IB182496]|uniref:Efflux RND transporter periplasmic adaptor subunit n=1 Tax=Paenibacillus sabuli TaxID=2772509 RepID=A0A927BS93_9BACL|nr:efflux RND transporter periplasmic adaptor subunit [Paenibacillus sabuli]MBD2845848.1 efflux RND transporter periplasmic adaptor subunit [Paenibacillus sabuli]